MDYLYFAPKTWIMYSLFCLLTYHFFINIRCKNIIKADPKINSKYPAFARDDMQNWGMIRMFPFYFWFWPKIIIGFTSILLTGFFYTFLMCGHKQGRPLGPIRKFIGNYPLRILCRFCMLLTNSYWIKTE
jgi:hypothetical protein